MSDYRRSYAAGGCYFFTVVTHDRKNFLTNTTVIERLREAFHQVKDKYPLTIDAIVILPDHIHTVWQLPEGDDDFSVRWRLIKHFVALKMDVAKNRRGEKQVWQRRFWEHQIRDEQDWRNHVDYIHYNPVKHGYVDQPSRWPYSSFSKAVERGWYNPDWGSSVPWNIQDMETE